MTWYKLLGLLISLSVVLMTSHVALATDTTPPVTKPSRWMGTYRDAQNVTLTCDDGAGNGCTATYYCLGSSCSPSTVYTEPITIAASTALRFYSTDLAGNTEPLKTYSYVIDPTLLYEFQRLWPQPEQPWYFQCPKDVATDPSGSVFVAESSSNRIQKFDGNGVFLTEWGSSGTGNGQFNAPYGIAADSEGNVYVSELFNHRIQKFDGEGNFLTQWGGLGSNNGQFNYPESIAVDAERKVYVADLYNNRIQIFDASGNYLSKFTVSNPYYVSVDHSGNVYVPDVTSSKVRMFDSAGVCVTEFGSRGSGNGQFSSPNGVAVDAGGNLYVVDSDNYRIQKLDDSGNYVTQWGTSGSNAGQFSSPRGIKIDNSGNVYVTDCSNNRVQKFTGNGQLLGQWGIIGSGIGQFLSPTSVAAATDGAVVVSDTGNNRIQKFDSSGNFQAQWGSYGTGLSQLDSPQGVSSDAEGNVYVADAGNRHIKKFDQSGNFLTQWGSYGEGNGQFYSPLSVVVTPDNAVYAGDRLFSLLQKFDTDGNFFLEWGSDGSGNGQFILPKGLATDTLGNIYVSDTGNNRIQKFDSSRSYLAQWGSGGSGTGQFNQPRGIATDATGNVYVADTDNHRVQKFDSNGNYLTQIGSRGSSNGQFLSPTGVAVDGSGGVIVVDSGNSRIQRFSPATGLPGAPTGVVAIPGNGEAVITFSAPASNGGSSITTYTVTSTPDNLTATGSESPITITGLLNGTAYTFTATATNGAGTGPASTPSNSITPAETVSGVCGSANGGSFATTPSANLCLTGSASTVTGTGPWNWTCQGTPGGTDASCSAMGKHYTLYVTKSGTGYYNGTVTADSGTLAWHGTSASASYPPSASVLLTAAVSTGSTFAGWSGCDSVNGNLCSVTMSGVRSVAADFPEVSSCSNDSVCGTGRYCSRPAGSCGGTGTCKYHPVLCSTVVLPVCGCNGVTYSNSCVAARAGASIAYNGVCDSFSCTSLYVFSPNGGAICWGYDFYDTMYFDQPKDVVLGGNAIFHAVHISGGKVEMRGVTVQ